MNIDLSKVAPLAGLIRKPHVNSTCIGCSACTAISGDIFVLDDNGLSCVQTRSDYENQDVDDAIAACPVNAISWQQANATDSSYANGVVEHQDV
ncbi:MAG: ferredoxin [Patescibacteria group bacterium]